MFYDKAILDPWELTEITFILQTLIYSKYDSDNQKTDVGLLYTNR